MKLCLKILAVATIAATSYSLTGCAGPASFSYQNIAISFAISCSDCPLGIIYNPAFPAATVSTTLGYGNGGVSPAGSVIYMDNQGQGGQYWFTANVTNAPPNITWNVYPQTDLFDITTLPNCTSTGTPCGIGESSGGIGTFVASGNTCDYAQNSISSAGAASSSAVPIWTGPALQQALAMGIPQGSLMLTASVPADPNNPSAVVTASQMIQMWAQSGNPLVHMTPCTPGSNCPSTAGNPSLTDSVANIPRGTSYQFTGFAVGAGPCFTTATCNAIYAGAPLNTSDNSVTWSVGNATQGAGASTLGGLVNGVAGPYGTISQSGLYTAPPTIPITGYQPIIVMAAHAAPTVTAVAYVTIQ